MVHQSDPKPTCTAPFITGWSNFRTYTSRSLAIASSAVCVSRVVETACSRAALKNPHQHAAGFDNFDDGGLGRVQSLGRQLRRRRSVGVHGPSQENATVFENADSERSASCEICEFDEWAVTLGKLIERLDAMGSYARGERYEASPDYWYSLGGRRFVEVCSEFYPQLGAWYELKWQEQEQERENEIRNRRYVASGQATPLSETKLEPGQTQMITWY